MTQVQDTVNQSMTSALTLLHPIATMNHNPNLQSLFFNPAEGLVLTGFRREVADLGAAFVCARYGRDNEVKVAHNKYERGPGIVNYEREGDYFETDKGLPGRAMDSGGYEAVSHAKALEMIEAGKAEVEGAFEVGLNAGAVYKFLDYLQKTHKEQTRDRKVNIMCTTDVIPQNHLIAVPERLPDGELVVMTKVVVKGQAKLIPLYIHENSKIHVTKLTPGMVYVVKPVSVDKQTGKRYADVLRPQHEGVRIAAQHFNMGIIKPGDPAYSVDPDSTNGLLARGVKNFSYLAGQKKGKVQGAPMMTIDLDIFYNLMKVFSAYSVVVMRFKNSTAGIYMAAKGNDYLPHIEALVAPTVQHVRGRIWLP
ncbi:hypothetical protein [Priestia megaterium]|uniref:hypothetical protein n=1 Tax=Priestia megaterium TaxID=1404 RepID=UPI002E1F072D|nr:hypothetical protein [Priestia megaterium]